MILKPFKSHLNENLLYQEGIFKGEDKEALIHVKRAMLFLRMHHGFFASLINAINVYEEKGLNPPTMATDGFVILYHPEWVHKHSHQEIMFVLAHEIMHNAMGHFVRQQDRHQRLFNIAADYAINPLIKGSIKDSEGTDIMSPPKNIMLDDKYSGKSAEQIYSILIKDEIEPRVEKNRQQGGSPPTQGQGQPGQGQPGQGQPGQGSGITPSPSSGEIDKAIDEMLGGDDGDGDEWNVGGTKPGGSLGEAKDASGKNMTPKEQAKRIKDLARKAARSMGGKYSEGSPLDQWLKGLAEPKVDWVSELNRFLRVSLEKSKDKIPYRRFAGRGLYFPGPSEDESLKKIVVGVDTSGSITPSMLDQFSAEISSIVGAHEIEALHVLYCDTAIVGHDEFRNPNELVIKKMPGGGGTLFQPMFDWIESNLNGPPDAMIIFTDGYPNSNAWGNVDFDDNNIIWIIANSPEIQAPFGNTINVKINDED